MHVELIKFYRIPKTKIAKNPSYVHMNFHGLHSTGHDQGPTTDDINKHACMLAITLLGLSEEMGRAQRFNN